MTTPPEKRLDLRRSLRGEMATPVHFHAEPGTEVTTPDRAGRTLVVEFPEGCADVEDPYLASVLENLAGVRRENHSEEKEEQHL